MEIIYSPHAKKRLRERKISKAAVIQTIKKPDKELSSDRNRIIAQRYFGNRILEVIYVKENNQIVIITLYYL